MRLLCRRRCALLLRPFPSYPLMSASRSIGFPVLCPFSCSVFLVMAPSPSHSRSTCPSPGSCSPGPAGTAGSSRCPGPCRTEGPFRTRTPCRTPRIASIPRWATVAAFPANFPAGRRMASPASRTPRAVLSSASCGRSSRPPVDRRLPGRPVPRTFPRRRHLIPAALVRAAEQPAHLLSTVPDDALLQLHAVVGAFHQPTPSSARIISACCGQAQILLFRPFFVRVRQRHPLACNSSAVPSARAPQVLQR